MLPPAFELESRSHVEIGKDIYIEPFLEPVPMHVEEHSALERNPESMPYIHLDIE